ncbi:MAG: serine/threonine protein kinase [Myxococcales bacterium]|nr:serine/threonine protein kinase [Myxococcales bacterium]
MNEPLRSPDSNTQLLGQKVGEYRLLREVGRGGMGVVFEAVHGETGEKVAVKAIHEKLLSNLTAVQRFVAEARLMARVDHPGLTKVFDSGQLPGGRPYFVMEFLVGESLRDRLRKKGRLAQREAVAIGEAMARALAIAHEKGIVHRDLKPDNVLLVEDKAAGGGELVKILDFGIAKAIAAGAGETLPGVQTATGLLLGTPTYMAPEQCRGGVEVTDRADVYSLGIVLYQLVSGTPPFASRSPGDVIAMHILEPLPPLADKAPDVARPLDELITVMLSKKPTDRPSMVEVAEKLHALRNVEPKTVLLAAKPAAERIVEAMQAMPTTELRANETRMLDHRPTAPAQAVAMPPAPEKPPLPSWLLVALLCAVILGGVTAAMLFR